MGRARGRRHEANTARRRPLFRRPSLEGPATVVAAITRSSVEHLNL
jgi:hypothetical protein